jgi:hypothetical protein
MPIIQKDAQRLTKAQIQSAKALKQGVSVLGVTSDESTQVHTQPYFNKMALNRFAHMTHRSNFHVYLCIC